VIREVLSEVFLSGSYPAETYGLILWSHATAWLPSNAKEYLRSFGQDKSDYMEINELRDALRGYSFDFIIFDACYMASIEVVYALRDNANYILASPTEVLGDGLPYHQVIGLLFKNKPIDELLKDTGHAFYTYYNTQQGGERMPRSASTTLISTANLPQLGAASREILQGKENAIYELPIGDIQLLERLGNPYHALYDFSDFVKQLATPEQYDTYKNCLAAAVIFTETTDIAFYSAEGDYEGFPIDRSRFCGLTAYLPQEQLERLTTWYKDLDWYKTVYE
jgi:hypothetical protein